MSQLVLGLSLLFLILAIVMPILEPLGMVLKRVVAFIATLIGVAVYLYLNCSDSGCGPNGMVGVLAWMIFAKYAFLVFVVSFVTVPFRR